MQDKKFWDVDRHGIVTELSVLACGHSPLGLDTVWAKTACQAADLAHRYNHGEYWLKGTVWHRGEEYHGVIRDIQMPVGRSVSV